jgi:hypothetical protein
MILAIIRRRGQDLPRICSESIQSTSYLFQDQSVVWAWFLLQKAAQILDAYEDDEISSIPLYSALQPGVALNTSTALIFIAQLLLSEPKELNTTRDFVARNVSMIRNNHFWNSASNGCE